MRPVDGGKCPIDPIQTENNCKRAWKPGRRDPGRAVVRPMAHAPPFRGGSTWIDAEPMAWADVTRASPQNPGADFAFCGARLQACRVDSRVDVLLRRNADSY